MIVLRNKETFTKIETKLDFDIEENKESVEMSEQEHIGQALHK